MTSQILVTEGIKFEAFPATLALPAESGSFPFMLLGIPKEPGQLIIKGYKVDVFGIENTVLLDTPITVQVTPVLPLLQLSSSLPVTAQLTHANPDDEDYQTLFTSVSLYRGHGCTATVTLENSGKIPITKISVALKKEKEKTVVFDENALQRHLPLEPGKTAEMSILVLGSQAWKLHPATDKIRAHMIFSYSGDDVEKIEYTRDISMVVDVKVMPSLQLSNFDIYELERHPTCCCLCFDVQNAMSVGVNVKTTVAETEEVTLRDGCPRTSEVEIPAKGNLRIGVHFPRCLLSVPELRRREKIEDVYTRAVKDSVTLEWRLSQSEYGGISYLSGLQLTPVMVHMLKPKHLEINISADDQKLREKEEFHTPKCKMIHVHAQLTNAHEMDLQDLVLSIRPYQEHREDIISKSPLVTWCGTLTKNIRKALGPVRLITSQFMTTERAIYQISRTGRTATHDAPWSFLLDLKWQSLLNSSFVYQILAEGQKDKKKVIKLSPGESFEHSCGLLFMFTGNYLVDVTCTVDKQRSPDVSRARAQAIIGQETTSPFPEFDTVDSGNIQVVVDGAVKTISTSAEFEEQKSKAQILHKPIADHWERNFAVLVK